MADCRICYENDKIENLLSPCLCTGSIKYVHKSCLNDYRNVCDNVGFIKCKTCNYTYNIETNKNNKFYEFIRLNKGIISEIMKWLIILFVFMFLDCVLKFIIDNNKFMINVIEFTFSYRHIITFYFNKSCTEFYFELAGVNLFNNSKFKFIYIVIFLIVTIPIELLMKISPDFLKQYKMSVSFFFFIYLFGIIIDLKSDPFKNYLYVSMNFELFLIKHIDNFLIYISSQQSEIKNKVD